MLGNDRNFSFSTSGALVFLANDTTLNTTPVWLSHDGEERELGLPSRPYSWVHISPEGTRVALDVSVALDDADIWIHDGTQRATRRFTFDAAAEHNPTWSPDV